MAYHRVGLVGGGTAGRGIARALAAAGIEVALLEVSPAVLERSLAAIKEGMNRDIARWALTEAERDAVLARLRGTTDPGDLAELPVVLESIQEDLKDKAALLSDLDARCVPDTVFLSNTSTLSLTELAGALSPARRARFAGLHFLHPVTRVDVVEVVRGRETGAEALESALELAEALGKQVIEVSEYPGYVTTRLTLAWINEAVHALMEGVATRDSIDRAMKLRFGSPLGPLALADEMGLDSLVRALESLWGELGLPQFRPCPLLRRMVNEGWLGEKSGRGFYRYDPGGRRLPEAEDLSLPDLERLLGP